MTTEPQQAPVPGSLLPYRDKINTIHTEDIFKWLLAGWHDFRASGLISFGYALIFVVAGHVITWGLFFAGYSYLIAPMIEAFLLVGPSLTVAFFYISKNLEEGTRPSVAGALLAWRRNWVPLASMGLMQLMFAITTARLAVLIFALNFPYIPLDVPRMVNVVLFTPEGITFLVMETLFGAVVALIVFLTGAISLPMMLDRKVPLIRALVISVIAVTANFRVMMIWAAVIVVVTGAGLITMMLGLAVTLPLIGHASWHAYRSLVRQDIFD
ncbi:MAG: DUF2189 domain-containing protein [Magnetospiraceae bacterium]